jgi:hypothetical protein
MATFGTNTNLNDAVPAAPAGSTNVTWQTDEFGNISAYGGGGGGGGGAEWGSITGTLSSQTDLQSALDAKASTSASSLTSGTLSHALLPILVSGDIPNNAANTTGTSAGLSANIAESQVTNLTTALAAKVTNGGNGYSVSPDTYAFNVVGYPAMGVYFDSGTISIEVKDNGGNTQLSIYPLDGNLVSNGTISGTIYLPSVVYSAAGTPLPAASGPLTGARAVVSDQTTTPTFMGVYVSGGAIVSPVFCTGTTWVTA